MAKRARITLPAGTTSIDAKSFRELVKNQAPESDVQAGVVECLAKHRWLVVRINSGGWYDDTGRYTPAYRIANVSEGESDGFSDLLALRGLGGPTCEAILVEAKRGKGGGLRASQRRFIALASSFGITVHVARSIEDILEHARRPVQK